MQVDEGSEAAMKTSLARKQAAAARHMPSARFTVTPKNEPPQEPPDMLGESNLSGMRLQDHPGYQQLVDERTKRTKRTSVTSAYKVRVQPRWIVDCDVCGSAVEPEQGPFESRQEADEAKQRHLDEHARGEYA